MPGTVLSAGICREKRDKNSCLPGAYLPVGETDSKQDKLVKLVYCIRMVVSTVEQNKVGKGTIQGCEMRDGWQF